MLVLDTTQLNTLYFSVDEDRYSDDFDSFTNTPIEIGDSFYSLSLYMREYYSEVIAIIYDASKGTEEEVIGYVEKEDRGVLKLFLDFQFEENKTYNLEVQTDVGDLLYRGSITTGNDYTETDGLNDNDLLKY